MKTLYWIYGLVDPRNNEVFYVGQTINPIRRLKEHIKDDHPLIPKVRRGIIDEILHSGSKPEIRILDVVYTDMYKMVREIEHIWVKLFKAQGQAFTNNDRYYPPSKVIKVEQEEKRLSNLLEFCAIPAEKRDKIHPQDELYYYLRMQRSYAEIRQ